MLQNFGHIQKKQRRNGSSNSNDNSLPPGKGRSKYTRSFQRRLTRMGETICPLGNSFILFTPMFCPPVPLRSPVYRIPSRYDHNRLLWTVHCIKRYVDFADNAVLRARFLNFRYLSVCVTYLSRTNLYMHIPSLQAPPSQILLSPNKQIEKMITEIKQLKTRSKIMIVIFIITLLILSGIICMLVINI